MSPRVPLLGALLLAAALNVPVRAQETKQAEAPPKEAADLVPASALVYVELRHPDKLAKEVAALTKGSPLEDMAATMGRFRNKLGDRSDFWFSDVSEAVGMFLSPEMLAEAGRLQGAFFAITGIGKDGPEMVGVVLSGSSNSPGLYLRTILTMHSEMRTREVVEGVQTYRAREQVFNRAPAPPGGALAPGGAAEFKDAGPTFAILPGAIVIGTKEATHDVIRRYKGKAKGDALTATATFKEAAKLRDRPGVYFQADLANLAKQMDAAFPDPKSADARTWSMFKVALNPAAFKSASGCLTLDEGKVGLHLNIDVDPKASSLVLDLIPERKGNMELLHAAPADGILNLALAMPDGETRWQRFLALADALAKEGGAKDVPSKQIREMEQQAKVNIGRDLFGKVGNLGLVLDARGGAHKDPLRPMLLLLAVDADAAKALEETVIPKVVGMGSKEEALPTREKILEQSVSILADPTKTWSSIAYGRSGKLVAIGPDRKAVAEALLRYSKKEGVLSHKTVGPALEKQEGAIGVGTASLGRTLVETLRELETEPAWKATPVAPRPGGIQPEDKKDPKKDDAPKTFEKFVALLAKDVEAIPPATVGLTRTKERLTLSIQTPGLQSYAAKVITVWVESALERALRERSTRQDPLPPIDPPPPPPPPDKEPTPPVPDK